MRWRLRRNIAKRRYQIIPVDDIGGISRRIILLNIVSSATTFSFSNSHALRHATPRHTASIEYGRVKPALSTLTHDFLSKNRFAAVYIAIIPISACECAEKTFSVWFTRQI